MTLTSSISYIWERNRRRSSANPSSWQRDVDVWEDEEVGQLFCVPKGSVTAVLLASIPPTPTTSVLPAPSTRPLPHPQPPILFTIRVRPPGWGFSTDHRFFCEICTIFYHFPLFIYHVYIYIFLILIGNSFLSIEALINFKLSREKFISFITFLSVLFIRSVSFISNSEKYLLLYRLCKKLHSLRLNILNDYYSIIKWRNSKNGILDRVTKDI